MESSSTLIVRGVLSLVLGVAAILWPGITLAVLVVLFAAWAFLDGVVNLTVAFTRHSDSGRSWVHALLGLVGVAAGVIALFVPAVTLFVLVLYIAAWAMIRGALELVAAFRLRRVIAGEWLLALSGTLSLLFGIALFAFPGIGALAIAWLLGAYAIAAGVTLVALGIRLRRPLAG